VKAEETLKTVADQVRVCTDCKLHVGRTHAVAGEGAVDSDLFFLGEGPGFHEDKQGRPFVGAAGKFLDELLAGIGLARNQVFITNLVKCRPPQNRDPEADELQACSKYLERQIQAINPKVIVTLGRFAMERFIPNAKISQIHGQARTVQGRLIVAMYHPAAALHQPSLRSVVEQDFGRLPDLIASAEQAPPVEDPEPSDPEQLSMF
jgi:DNA polymerase